MGKRINKKEFQHAEKEGWIVSQKHPKYDIYIYNYTQKAQYERMWNALTLSCRGLILDTNYSVIARPFPKFFNWEELDAKEVPTMNFEVYDKMDGSLGILYWVENIPYIATRGSFTSEQATKANELLYGKYRNSIDKLDYTKTYLFEIIYPENRVVLDYGNKEELVLLAIIETATGNEYPLEDIGFPVVKKYNGINSLEEIKKMNDDAKEGFVIRFANNFRMKVKFQEYIRLHRIITEVSSLTVWEYMKDNLSFEELLEKVPDEFYNWVRSTRKNLSNQFEEIEKQCKKEFKILETRKETAAYFMTKTNSKVLFAMLDNRDYSKIIWKKIKPKYQKPFTVNLYSEEYIQ